MWDSGTGGLVVLVETDVPFPSRLKSYESGWRDVRVDKTRRVVERRPVSGDVLDFALGQIL